MLFALYNLQHVFRKMLDTWFVCLVYQSEKIIYILKSSWSDISSLYKNRIEGKFVDSRPTEFMYNLPIIKKKKKKSLFYDIIEWNYISEH